MKPHLDRGTQDQDVKNVDRWMKIQDLKQQVIQTKKILHVPGTKDQDVKDVDRWMKIQDLKQQVILVLDLLYYVHSCHS